MFWYETCLFNFTNRSMLFKGYEEMATIMQRIKIVAVLVFYIILSQQQATVKVNIKQRLLTHGKKKLA